MKMFKARVFIILLFVFIGFLGHSQSNTSTIKWLTIEEAEKLCKENPKPMLIDFYTDWCGWCKKMDIETYTDSQVAGYVNNFFYPVKMDAETPDTIVFRDSVYVNQNKGNRSSHDLAIQLLEGRMSYPSTLFMDREMKKITVVPGFHKAMELLPILIFINEDIYKTGMAFQDFDKYFKQTYPPSNISNYSVTPSVVNWLSLEEALELNKKEPKKILLDIFVNWKVSCTMMMTTTYNHPELGEYINKNYYPVRLDATTRDTLFFGQEYFNEGNAPSYHQLPVAMLQGKMNFPAILWLDENNKLINLMQMYLTPESLEPILVYFAEDKYKSTKWQEFSKDFETRIFSQDETGDVIVK